MHDISISIVIPVYQAELFLQDSVESVLTQTLTDIEIILVNDGSKDRSGIICNEIASKDKRVKVIHKENEGQSAARNAGIDAAKGKYISFMDHDDFIYPDMCMKLFKNAEKYDVDISAGSFIRKDEKGTISHNKHTSQLFVYNNKEGVKAFFSREIIDIYVWTKIYRKDFLDRNNIRFEKGRSDEDWLFNSSAFFSAGKIVMEDTPLYIYIEYANSTCRTFHVKNIRKFLDDTCYRIQKIETGIQKNYPDLLYLSQRQSIKACVRMLFITSKYKKSDCEPYYSWIKKYLYSNAQFFIHDRQYWNMSLGGVLLAAYTPTWLYFYIKKWKHRHDI